jgi:hypothetical protein
VPPWFDLVVLLGIVISTVWWTIRLRRRGLRGGRFAAAALVGFLGLALLFTMTAHNIDVLSRLVVGTGYDGAVFGYNFRTYSLLLLGSVLIAAGARLLSVSSSIGTQRDARGPAARVILIVLALVVPLIPIHGFFAIPLSATAGAAMLLVLWRVSPVTPATDPMMAVAAIRG